MTYVCDEIWQLIFTHFYEHDIFAQVQVRIPTIITHSLRSPGKTCHVQIGQKSNFINSDEFKWPKSEFKHSKHDLTLLTECEETSVLSFCQRHVFYVAKMSTNDSSYR